MSNADLPTLAYFAEELYVLTLVRFAKCSHSTKKTFGTIIKIINDSIVKYQNAFNNNQSLKFH